MVVMLLLVVEGAIVVEEVVLLFIAKVRVGQGKQRLMLQTARLRVRFAVSLLQLRALLQFRSIKIKRG
jgi:hypothetical protein